MERLSYISLLIVTLFSTAFAQNNSPCPKVEFILPNSAIYPGDKMPFSISLSDEAKNLNLEYKWTVSAGAIIEGQGTSSIKVATTGLEAILIKATVEIKSFPNGCLNTFSENGVVASRLPSCPIYDEYNEADDWTEKLSKIDITMTVLENVPELTALFYLNFKNPTQKRINSRLSQIRKLFAHRGYSANRVIFIVTKSEDDHTRIYTREIKENEKFECSECDILKIIKGSEINFNK